MASVERDFMSDSVYAPGYGVEFTDDRRAIAFERNLKSGSGGAFATRHFR